MLASESTRNSKFEIRSMKQIQIFKEQKILNGPVWNFGLFQISPFRFCYVDARRDKFRE